MKVTDKDREAAARCACARDREEVAEAIATARAEEREACAKVCDDAAARIRTSASMVVGNSTQAEVKRGTRGVVAVALSTVAENIRARGGD